MSRIGKKPIQLPKNVKVEINGSHVKVSGAKGSLERLFHPEIGVAMENDSLVVTRSSDSREQRALHGLTRALLNNMVVGVSNGFSKSLAVEGVGYRAEMSGQTLVLFVGYSHPVRFDSSNDIKFAVEEKGKVVVVSGINKEYVGEIAAQIRKVRPPEPYKGKGIRYVNETIRRKAGKTGKV